MNGKMLLIGSFLLLTLLTPSCGTSPQPTTSTPPSSTIPPTSIPIRFVSGECQPDAKPIELNKRYSGGVGCGYIDVSKYSCAMYCLWVPDGSQLKIGITDSFSDLLLHVERDLFEGWDSGESWTSDEIGRNKDELITIQNPGGRYYISVCQKTGGGCQLSGQAVVFTDAALFSLSTEFSP
jgi:hypothetical protein